MAVDMFLKIEGLDGESANSKHGKEIDVLSWEFGVTQSGTMHIATGGGSGKASFSDLKVEKWVDAATVNLFGAVSNGKHYDSAVLTVRKAGGAEAVEYLKYELTSLIITSYQSGHTIDDDEQVRETVKLNFAKIAMKYKPQNKEGAGGAEKAYTYDIAQNTKM